MEQTKNGWDLFLLPKEWHRKLNANLPSLIPGIIIVGLFDAFCAENSIFFDFIIGSTSKVVEKTLLFLLSFIVIGFLDVLCFAWPIADLCRYIARRSEKFIAKDFNVIFMKAYAYSHLLFFPVLLILNPTSFQFEKLSHSTPKVMQIIIITLLVWGSLQIFIQPGILMRTINTKSKIGLSGKVIMAIVIFIWINITSGAITYLGKFAYKMFKSLYIFT